MAEPIAMGRAAENIAYSYDSFERTLDQWIASTGRRKNLLLHNASRVGVASATSAISHRTYWAMEIAANISRCGQLQARERRLQQKENCLYNLAEREFSVSGLIRRDGGDARRGPTMFARISVARPPRSR
jgi:hypothetical protein